MSIITFKIVNADPFPDKNMYWFNLRGGQNINLLNIMAKTQNKPRIKQKNVKKYFLLLKLQEIHSKDGRFLLSVKLSTWWM